MVEGEDISRASRFDNVAGAVLDVERRERPEGDEAVKKTVRGTVFRLNGQ